MKREIIQNNDYKYARWMCVEVLLLILNIIFTVKLDIERLDAISIVNISFDWIAMFILIIRFQQLSGNHYQKAALKTLRDDLKGFPLATYLQHSD